jgi:predicted ATPase
LVVATLDEPPQGKLTDPKLLSLFIHRNCNRLALEPLSAADVADYLAQAWLPNRAIRERIYDMSGGNPLYLTELVDQVQQGAIVDPNRVMPPATATQLMRRQLAALAADTRSVLEAAALLGTEFCLPRLAAATGRSPAALMPALDQALEAGVVRGVAQSVTHFAFTHSLLRRALYQGQALDDRVVLPAIGSQF